MRIDTEDQILHKHTGRVKDQGNKLMYRCFFFLLPLILSKFRRQEITIKVSEYAENRIEIYECCQSDRSSRVNPAVVNRLAARPLDHLKDWVDEMGKKERKMAEKTLLLFPIHIQAQPPVKSSTSAKEKKEFRMRHTN